MFYDKLAKLFGKNQAIGEKLDTTADMRGKRSNVGNNYAETVEELDHLVETNEVTLEGFENVYADEEFHTKNSHIRPTVTQSQYETSSRTKKRAKKESIDKTGMSELSKIFQKVANVFEMSAIEMIKKSKNASSEDIWVELVNIDVESTLLSCVYMYHVKIQI